MKIGHDYRRTCQALCYAGEKLGGMLDKLQALKLIYFADRYHLRKYGRTITNDNYTAMEFGPVASTTKDILEHNKDFISKKVIDYVLNYIRLGENYQIVILRSPDMDELSETDLEALNYVLEKYGKLDRFELSKLTHEYPEWKKFEEELVSGNAAAYRINIEDFFEDPENPSIDLLHELDDEEKSERIEEYREKKELKKMWK